MTEKPEPEAADYSAKPSKGRRNEANLMSLSVLIGGSVVVMALILGPLGKTFDATVIGRGGVATIVVFCSLASGIAMWIQRKSGT